MCPNKANMDKSDAYRIINMLGSHGLVSMATRPSDVALVIPIFRLSEAGVARFLPIALVKPLKLNGLSLSIMVTNPPEPNMMHSATSSGLFHYQSLDLPCLESIIPSCFDLDRMVIYCWCKNHITRCFYAVAIFTDSFRPQTKQLMIRNFQDSHPKKKHVTTSRQPGREKPPLIWTSQEYIDWDIHNFTCLPTT